MKLKLRIVAVAALILATGGPAFAQFGAPGGTISIPGLANLPNQRAWDAYLASHPTAAAELSANPNLMYDSKWRAKHPGFRKFIGEHSKDWAAMRSQGAQYYDQKFNGFLSHHPKLATRLNSDPSLLYNPNFRRAHPALNDYLARHGGVRKTLHTQRAAAAAPAYLPPGSASPGYGAVPGGDYDEHHHWHDAGWWRDHHPGWARDRHPEWWYEHKQAIAEKHRDHGHWMHEQHDGGWSRGHHGHDDD